VVGGEFVELEGEDVVKHAFIISYNSDIDYYY
jgi:hypothetical protein